jgi:hypothetical protein
MNAHSAASTSLAAGPRGTRTHLLSLLLAVGGRRLRQRGAVALLQVLLLAG